MEPFTNPFTVCIDTAEGQPWKFTDLKCDANRKRRPLVVPWKYQSLGRYPDSYGDYSIEGFEGKVAIERKSPEDCWSTVLGWGKKEKCRTCRGSGKVKDKKGEQVTCEVCCGEGKRTATGRRDRFEKELKNLSDITAIVIVEAGFSRCLRTIPDTPKKSAASNRKTFNRSIIAFMQDYKVPWLFCESRRHAEIEAFRYLERFWRKNR